MSSEAAGQPGAFVRTVRGGLTPTHWFDSPSAGPVRPRTGPAPLRYAAPMIDLEHFERVEMRVGRIVAAEPFPEARKPSYRLRIDFGPEVGERVSSAQLPITYPDREALLGRQVVAVLNFPPRRIAGFSSEVLVLGAMGTDGEVFLLRPDPPSPDGLRIG
jgi:tRNA-binding protein